MKSKELSFNQGNLFPLHQKDLPLKIGPEPKTDLKQTLLLAKSKLSINLENAPALLKEWVGRTDFLANLSQDWANIECKLVGLIGFGGEGKTSIARHWIDHLLNNKSLPQPTGVFWWGFYENNNVDEFFEAALNYLSGGQINLETLTSAHAKANFLAGMLKAGRYLFILDGIEVLQHQSGDEYGLLINNDLFDFLDYVAASEHESFCLLTSRAPLYDLIHYITCIHRDVDRLNPEDGKALLKKVGVKGKDTELDRIVSQWGGHALTLSLLGSYLVKEHKGNVNHIPLDLVPTVNEEKYDRVTRILRRYDEHLNDGEKEFMEIFSAFRLPVCQSAIEPVFKQTTSFVEQLVKYRILRFNPQNNSYTTHPLIRNHYLKLLEQNPLKARKAHEKIRNYYFLIANSKPIKLTLDGLQPQIELVHHSCQAGDYNKAWSIYWENLEKQNRHILTGVLCAYDTTLEVLKSFFPNNDFYQQPLIDSKHSKCKILEKIGFCLTSLGHLTEAKKIYKSAKKTALSLNNWHQAIIAYHQLAEIQVHLGKLNLSKKILDIAFSLVQQKGSRWLKMESLVYQGRIAYLKGQLDVADNFFEQAKELQRQIDFNYDINHLYSWRGIWYVEYLIRLGDLAYAQAIAEENLDICQKKKWFNLIGKCHRIIGDITAAREQNDSAGEHYDMALKIARRVNRKDSLIEALIARGKWSLRWDEIKSAKNDLNEALNYSLSSSYHLYELDIRLALAWLDFKQGNPIEAKSNAEWVNTISKNINYHWGQVDSAKLLQEF